MLMSRRIFLRSTKQRQETSIKPKEKSTKKAKKKTMTETSITPDKSAEPISLQALETRLQQVAYTARRRHCFSHVKIC